MIRMATFVLIHGGGHGGWCYQRVARLLRANGHEVHTPSLSGCGEHAHQVHAGIDLDTHIDDVLALLFSEDLRDVILVGHSYGGMVITGVADRGGDRIGKVVYLDAANPKNGESLDDVAGGLMALARSMGEIVDGVELVLQPDSAIVPMYGVTEPDDIEWVTARLTPHPWQCFEQKLEFRDEAALLAIPTFHVICTSTLEGRDKELMDAARAESRLWMIDTGHDLMLTEPQAVTDAFEEIASR
jgi:pimeloyl-ACP methyl ester carboxylesterase